MAHLSEDGRRARVVELREQGMSYREIGRTVGISHERARRIARDAGVTALTAVPSGLASRGQAFWDHTVGVFELDRHEQEVLTQVCRLLDVCDSLQARVDEDGVTVTTTRGDVRAHPALVELRQVSLAVARMLAQLEVPSEDEDATVLRSGRSARAAKAANSRWNRRREQRGSA